MALAIPAPLLGIELIHLLDDPDLPWLNGLYHTNVAPILGQAIRAVPLALFIVWFGFRSIPQEQFEAAAIDGAGRFARFWHIVLPIRRLAIVVAWIIAFIYCFGELPTTQLLQPPGPMTLPVAIYQLMHGSGEDRLAGIVLATIIAYLVVAAALVFATKLLARTRHGQGVLR
jgi:ABC-type Fe3+ transport system permease subunit